jgi:hypothetical protein
VINVQIWSRMQALVDMLKVNISIHAIRFPNCYYYREHELFRSPIIPYLETNRLRPRVRAIQKTRPIEYCAKVLGRALLAIRTDANSLWMLLSGNAEVAFLSTTAMISPATNLPTPATAVATSAGASAAASVATPTACQKRNISSLPHQGFITRSHRRRGLVNKSRALFIEQVFRLDL